MYVRSDCRIIRSRFTGSFILPLSCVLVLSGCTPSFPVTTFPRLDAALMTMRLLLAGGVLALFATAVASFLAHRAIAAHRRREEELALRHTVLTLQQQTSLDDIIAVDRHGTVIFHNRRYPELWEGRDAADPDLQPRFQQVIQPLLDKVADARAFLEMAREVVDHPAQRKKAQIALKDGRVLEAYSAPTRGVDGTYAGRVWYFRDVSARMEAQRALEESESLFRGLVKSAADALVIVNASLEIVMANEQFDSMFGYSHGEVIGRNLEILIPPRFARHHDYASEFVKNPRRRLMGHGLELVALRKNGSEFPVEIGLSPLQTTQGLVVSAAIRDISARKAAERQLAAAAAYARSLLEASPDPLFTVSPQGIITDVNDASVRLTGLPRESIIGSGFSGHFSDAGRAERACREVFSHGHIRDYPLAVINGSEASEILFNATVYSDDTGAVAGMLATARDMRERNRVEAELRELNRSLEERVEQRTRELLGSSREIVAAAETIAAISGEITATSHQVLASAVQTASAVTQTTATVEEVKQTALNASDTARNVTLAAQHSLKVAQGGKQAMLASTEGLLRIRDHVASGAEGMARLRRQSKAIADIIATVNDLADQSNLLAVNAAIEASKAGKQGKGFAVVAQEVKNLAEQSKRATARVGAILNDIRAATDEAVRLSQQGLEAVREGIEQAAVAEDAIVQMAGSIETSTQAALQIAASCQQQLAGMAQVAQAVESIREASTHNIHGMNEVDATLRHLRALGEKLKQLDMRLGRTE